MAGLGGQYWKFHCSHDTAPCAFPPNDSGMLLKAQYDILCDAASQFQDKPDFGLVEVEEVMENVFGSYETRGAHPDVAVWAKYFSDANQALGEPSEFAMPTVRDVF